MKKVVIGIMLVFVMVTTIYFLDNEFIDSFFEEEFILEHKTALQSPIGEVNEDENMVGVITEPVAIESVSWEEVYKVDQYSILKREVPEGLVFNLIAYNIEEDPSCSIGEYTRYKFIVLDDGLYFDIYDYHKKYNNLTCEIVKGLSLEN